MNEIFYLIGIALVDFILALCLYKKITFFKKFISIPILILSAIVSSVLHNLVYALFYGYFTSHSGDEAFFFILTFLLLGTGAFLAFIQLTSFLIKTFKKQN